MNPKPNAPAPKEPTRHEVLARAERNAVATMLNDHLRRSQEQLDQALRAQQHVMTCLAQVLCELVDSARLRVALQEQLVSLEDPFYLRDATDSHPHTASTVSAMIQAVSNRGRSAASPGPG